MLILSNYTVNLIFFVFVNESMILVNECKINLQITLLVIRQTVRYEIGGKNVLCIDLALT